MSHNRQPGREATIGVRSLGLRLPTGRRLDAHNHDWGQLIFASEGVMTVETAHGTWIVPPGRAVWVPRGVPHAIETTGEVAMRTLYVRPDCLENHAQLGAARLPETCSVVHVSALLRELVLHVVERGMLDEHAEPDRSLIGVLLSQLHAAQEMPLELPLPRDARARRVADRIRRSPAEPLDGDELAQGSGASRRTLERVFQRDTGMSLGRWRQHARLLHGLKRLAAGVSVTEAAFDAGYESTSAFIAVFKRTFGKTPGRYWSGD